MAKRKEITEIREMIDIIKNSNSLANCAKTRYDEELQDNVSYLSHSDTTLSVAIIEDTGFSYKHFNHPLCLYVVRPENEEEVFPVTISENPQTTSGNTIPNDVREFIVDNVQLLTDAANLIIDGFDFYDGVDAW